MNIDDFKKVVEQARAQNNIYENAAFWQAVFNVARAAACRYLHNAAVQEKESAMSDFYTNLLALRKNKLDELCIDIFYDYSAERLMYTVIKISSCAAISAYKKTANKNKRETSIYTELDGDRRSDCKLMIVDTLPDRATAPDVMSELKCALRKLLNVKSTDRLVAVLGIKRAEFCDKTENTVSAKRFVAVLDLYLQTMFEYDELKDYYIAVLDCGSVNIQKLYNRIYNENRKTNRAEPPNV